MGGDLDSGDLLVAVSGCAVRWALLSVGDIGLGRETHKKIKEEYGLMGYTLTINTYSLDISNANSNAWISALKRPFIEPPLKPQAIVRFHM